MRTFTLLVLLLALATAAFADATADAKKVDEAFGTACAAGDVKAVLDLYVDDALVIWPGVGEEAKTKPGIQKLATALCDPKLGTRAILKDVVGRQLDPTHIAIVGHWDFTQNGPDGKPTTSQIRTSEIIAKNAGKWRNVISHASIGVPSEPAK